MYAVSYIQGNSHVRESMHVSVDMKLQELLFCW